MGRMQHTKPAARRAPQPQAAAQAQQRTPTHRADRFTRSPAWAQSRPPALQAKLTINPPGDVYEQEADRVADQVMRMPAPQVQRKCAACEEEVQRQPLAEEEEELQMKEAGPAPSSIAHATAPPSVQSVLGAPGRPLDGATRAFMEPRFGQSFGHVRVHTDAQAAESARNINARAYTVGRNVVFGAGQYAPGTGAGQRLMAHELTHVVQQGTGTARMIYRQEESETAPLTRWEEIRLSRTSPGQATIQSNPYALSLYNFAINSDQPKEYHNHLTEELARFISQEINIPTRIRVVGHASNPGTFTQNEDLAQRRAEAVAEMLQQHGLSNVSVFSRGEENPVVSNDTVAGRSRNRRVDIKLFPGRLPSPTDTPDEPTPGPGPEPPETTERERDWCEQYPLLCDLIPIIPIPILPPIPIPWHLICALAPELCVLIPCMINPAMCAIGPPEIPEPPEPERPEPEEEERLPRVEFSPVRADNTPDAMGDRIPDQGSTAVIATVTGYRPTMPPIRIVRLYASPMTGEFLINGATETSITGTTTLNIAGTSQTTSAAADFWLELQALMGTEHVGRSDPFAVAAIMENMKTELEGLVEDWISGVAEDRGVGLRAKMTWDSDGASGYNALDQVFFDERLEVLLESGGMRGIGLGAIGFDEPGDFPIVDYHGTEEAQMQELGSQEVMQLYVMTRNERTGESGREMIISNSGFVITRRVEPDPGRPGCFQFVVSKVGTAGSVEDLHSGAGEGRAEPDPVPIPCRRGGGGGGGGDGGGGDGDGGGGRSRGTIPATPTTPTAHRGPIPGGTTPFGFVRLFPSSVIRGMPVMLTIFFFAWSSSRNQSERRAFTSSLPCIVTNVTDTHIVLRTINHVPLNLAPSGFRPVVLSAHKTIHIPRSLIQ